MGSAAYLCHFLISLFFFFQASLQLIYVETVGGLSSQSSEPDFISSTKHLMFGRFYLPLYHLLISGAAINVSGDRQ